MLPKGFSPMTSHKNILPRILPARLLVLFGVLCLLAAARPASAVMTFYFQGIVNSVTDPNGDAPTVAIGNSVSAVVTYDPAYSFLHLSSAAWNWFQFNPGGMTLVVTVNSQEFSLDAANSAARTFVQFTSPHLLRLEALADPTLAGTNFANAYVDGRQSLELRMFDSVAPLELLSSLALPTVPTDVDLTAMSGTNFGFVNARNADGTREWAFTFILQQVHVDGESPVTTESSNFGAIKALY